MSTTELFAKLWAMNWVEKDHARRLKLEEDSGPVLDNLVAAIEDAVKSFNRIYRGNKPIVMNASPNRVSLSCPLPLPKKEGELVKRADALIVFTEPNFVVSASFFNTTAKETAVWLDANDAEVFMRDSGGHRIPDADAASRFLLEDYLNGLK